MGTLDNSKEKDTIMDNPVFYIILLAVGVAVLLGGFIWNKKIKEQKLRDQNAAKSSSSSSSLPRR